MLKYSDGTSQNEPLICKLHSQHLGIGDTRKHIDGFKHKLFYRVEMYTYLIGVMDQYELATLVQNSRMIYFFICEARLAMCIIMTWQINAKQSQWNV